MAHRIHAVRVECCLAAVVSRGLHVAHEHDALSDRDVRIVHGTHCLGSFGM